MTFHFTKADRWSSSYSASFSQFDKRILPIIFFSIDFYRCVLSAKVRGISEQLLCFPDCCASPLSSATKENKKALAIEFCTRSLTKAIRISFLNLKLEKKHLLKWDEIVGKRTIFVKAEQFALTENLFFFLSSSNCLWQVPSSRIAHKENLLRRCFHSDRAAITTNVACSIKHWTKKKSTFYRKSILKKKTAAE